MANIPKCARATMVMNKVKGKDPHVFNSKFAGYNEATEGIFAQQMEADRRLKELQAQKALRLNKIGC